MKAIDFQNKYLDPKIPTFVRNIVEQAVTEINAGNFDSIELTEPEFYAVCRYGNITPNKTHTYDWFRIFDELDNGKDIEILNPYTK